MTVVDLPRSPRHAFTPSGRELLLVLAGAAAVELILLRLVTRTAIHVPAFEDFAGVYRFTSSSARLAYYVSVAVLVAALGMLALHVRSPVARVAVVWFLIVAAATRAGLAEPFFTSLAVTAVVIALAYEVAIDRSGRAQLVLALFAAAFAASGLYSTVIHARQIGLEAPTMSVLLDVSEVLVVVAALIAPWAVRAAPTRLDWIIGAIFGFMVLGALTGSGSATRILMLWNLGLAGSLPSVVYALATGAVVLTVAALSRRAADRGLVLAAILMLLAGGLGLHSTYQSGLVVAGLAVLVSSSSPIAATTFDTTRSIPRAQS